MDALFHLVFAFIAGMAVNARLDHRPVHVLLVAVAAVLIDIDHLLFAYNRAFHTVFVAVGVPLLLFVAAYRWERGTDRIRLQSLSLLLLVMLVGHLVADLFDGGMLRVLYPVSGAAVAVPAGWTVSVVQPSWHLVAPEGVALLLYGLVIGAAYYAEEVIVLVERRHEALRRAVREALTA